MTKVFVLCICVVYQETTKMLTASVSFIVRRRRCSLYLCRLSWDDKDAHLTLMTASASFNSEKEWRTSQSNTQYIWFEIVQYNTFCFIEVNRVDTTRQKVLSIALSSISSMLSSLTGSDTITSSDTSISDHSCSHFDVHCLLTCEIYIELAHYILINLSRCYRRVLIPEMFCKRIVCNLFLCVHCRNNIL